MKFSFGIVTNGSDLIEECIQSIMNLKIPEFEIIIVGKYNQKLKEKINFIEYNDKSINGDISIKKNIITKNSKYENIVYLHDYIIHEENWYKGFLLFGNNFEVCITKILNKDNTRYRDWCLWQDDAEGYTQKNNYLIPYEVTNITKMMYISGAYWVAKKEFMLKNLLNENLSWGQGEDVEWSLRVRNKTIFKVNTKSIVKLAKQKDKIFNEIDEDEKFKLLQVINYDNNLSYKKLIDNHLSIFLINKSIEKP